VDDGNVKLEGSVEWEYQRNNAKTAIEHLAGVRSITNLIEVMPTITPTLIQQKIYNAFQRNASIDAGKITAEVKGSRVILRGKVRSIVEKEDAVTTAWNAPGVAIVENKLEVEEPAYELEY